MSNNIHSLDPRINRLDLNKTAETKANSHGITWEVFHQERKGKQAVHAGVVHAETADLALVFAKEAFGRRGRTANIWVVKTSDVYSFAADEEDIFSTTPEKLHREPASYKVRDRIEAYRKRTQG